MYIWATHVPDCAQLFVSRTRLQQCISKTISHSLNTEQKELTVQVATSSREYQSRVKCLPSVRSSHIAVIQMCGFPNQPHCQHSLRWKHMKVEGGWQFFFSPLKLQDYCIWKNGYLSKFEWDRKPHTVQLFNQGHLPCCRCLPAPHTGYNAPLFAFLIVKHVVMCLCSVCAEL